MKTNNDLSAHSAKGLGAVVAHAVVAHASQRGNQRNVTLGSVTYYAMMLLMMLLTTASAWADGDVVEVSQVNSRKRYYDDTWSILLHAKF